MRSFFVVFFTFADSIMISSLFYLDNSICKWQLSRTVIWRKKKLFKRFEIVILFLPHIVLWYRETLWPTGIYESVLLNIFIYFFIEIIKVERKWFRFEEFVSFLLHESTESVHKHICIRFQVPVLTKYLFFVNEKKSFLV